MATDKQIEANQRNAQKCTGPISAEGKAKSSQNAMKTGLYAKSDVIATENRDDYDTLIAEYYDRFQPVTPEERCLVDNLVQTEWLGRRYMAATTAIWDCDFRTYNDQDMGSAFMRNSQVLGRAQRCITANQRNYANTLKQLQAIQANRAKSTADPVPATENEPLNAKLVSFPQINNTPHDAPAQTAISDQHPDEKDDAAPSIAA